MGKDWFVFDVSQLCVGGGYDVELQSRPQKSCKHFSQLFLLIDLSLICHTSVVVSFHCTFSAKHYNKCGHCMAKLMAMYLLLDYLPIAPDFSEKFFNIMI